MFKFQISFSREFDRSAWNQRENAVWESGRSWIEPFRNPALEHALASTAERTVFAIREKISGRQPFSKLCSPDLLASQTRRWPGDYLLLQIERDVVTLEAGHWGSAPIYLTSDMTTFYGSWDFADHRKLVSSGSLDHAELIRFLVLQQRYSARTFSQQVHRLTERARAVWSPGQEVAIQYPAHGVHYRPRKLRAGAQVVDAYGRLLSAAVRQRDLAASDVVVELSGGTDSATVALTAGECLKPGSLHSYGLLIGGEARAQQINRRGTLAGLAGLSDVSIDALDHLPLAPSASAGAINPYEEPYRDAVTAALDEVPHQVVLTGIGGDELFALRPEERQPKTDPVRLPAFLTASARDLANQLVRDPDVTAPVTVIPETALLASLVRAPVFLRAGRWPVSPLCSIELVQFGEWLPLNWRKNKRLPRQWLLSKGVPRQTVWPEKRENFAHVMQAGLRHHGLAQLRQMLTDGALLVDLGYVDADALVTLSSTADTRGERGDHLDIHLHELLALERVLRNLFG